MQHKLIIPAKNQRIGGKRGGLESREEKEREREKKDRDSGTQREFTKKRIWRAERPDANTDNGRQQAELKNMS